MSLGTRRKAFVLVKAAGSASPPALIAAPSPRPACRGLSARIDCVRSDSRSADEQLLRRLMAPPDLEDGVRSLGYWRGRNRHLPWYRLRARREAVRMTARWEQRVGAALLAQRGVPAATRLSAALAVTQ